jgi:L-aminopeptidase/D-esterase-like protein
MCRSPTVRRGFGRRAQNAGHHGAASAGERLTGTIVDVPGITVGHADVEQRTGCTAVLCGPEGAVGGVDVRGSAPGTRETDALDPVNIVERVHAVVLSGGSAFGLDAATGVMTWLHEQHIGHRAAGFVIPIVPAAVLFDLPFSGGLYPNRNTGYAAARAASSARVAQGNVGAGCGATVGKLRGARYAMKSGLGSASFRAPSGLVVGAIVAVNALGSVVDPQGGRVLAGMLDDDGMPQNAATYVIEHGIDDRNAVTNTTIGIVATNARLTKAQAKKLASWSHDAYARTIAPAHTMFDGDTIFALATGDLEAAVNVVGTIAVEVMSQAVMRAAMEAAGAGSLRAYRDFQPPPG